MTCIIGLVKDGNVYMGCDSAAMSDWSDGRATRLRKVFRVDDFLIGYTYSFRMGQILQHHLKVEKQGAESDEHYMVVTFVEAVRECLKKYGFAKVELGQESGGDFLVGYRSQLYHVATDFQVNIFDGDLDACGCGGKHALGAMAALEFLPPEKRIKRALKIAARFAPGVCGPFHIEVLEVSR